MRDSFGYGLPEAEPLAYLDGTYRTLEYHPDLSSADVNADVLAEALRLTS